MFDQHGDVYEAKSDEEYQEIIQQIGPVIAIVHGKKAMLKMKEEIEQSLSDDFEAEGVY